MNTDKIIKEARIIMYAALIVGMALLAVGIAFAWTDARIISNNRSVIGLSFIPLTVSFFYYLKLIRIRNNPQTMKAIIINENDERLNALKNEADARAHKIVQAALFLAYMGYTLIVPEDIFESVGWWILLLILMLSLISQGILTAASLRKEQAIHEENE